MRKEKVFLGSYADCVSALAKARDKLTGKMISTMFHLRQDCDEYVVSIDTSTWDRKTREKLKRLTELCRYREDGTVVFTLTQDALMRDRYSLAGTAYRFIPFVFSRAAHTMYRVGYFHRELNSYESMAYGEWRRKSEAAKNAPLFFPGITFKISDDGATCLNAYVVEKPVAIPDVRKQWIADCQRFRMVLKTMVRVGALETAIKARTGGVWQPPALWTDKRTARVVACMKANICPEDVVDLVIDSVSTYTLKHHMEHGSLNKLIDAIFSNHSLSLRHAYGVFGEGVKLNTGVGI